MKGWVKKIREVAAMLAEDGVTLYAARASFFILISAIPLLSLLLSAVGLFLQEPAGVLSFPGSRSSAALAGWLLEQARDVPTIPVLSATGLAVLWSASRGMAAVRMGIRRAYGLPRQGGVLFHRLRAAMDTLLAMVLFPPLCGLLLVGQEWWRRLTPLWAAWRIPLLLAVMTATFGMLYSFLAEPEHKLRRLKRHLPGAVFSATGWVLFSYGYSLYLRWFPRSGSIYGGLAAVCLVMVWLYFCITILLLGAEVNKLVRKGQQNGFRNFF